MKRAKVAQVLRLEPNDECSGSSSMLDPGSREGIYYCHYDCYDYHCENSCWYTLALLGLILKGLSLQSPSFGYS